MYELQKANTKEQDIMIKYFLLPSLFLTLSVFSMNDSKFYESKQNKFYPSFSILVEPKQYVWPKDEKINEQEDSYNKERARFVGELLQKKSHWVAEAFNVQQFIMLERPDFEKTDKKNREKFLALREFAIETGGVLSKYENSFSSRPQLNKDLKDFLYVLRQGWYAVLGMKNFNAEEKSALRALRSGQPHCP